MKYAIPYASGILVFFMLKFLDAPSWAAFGFANVVFIQWLIDYKK
jgi:hypothetical protein